MRNVSILLQIQRYVCIEWLWSCRPRVSLDIWMESDPPPLTLFDHLIPFLGAFQIFFYFGGC